MNAFIAAGLTQALGGFLGILQGVAALAFYGGLIGALVAGLSERHIGSAKNALVIAGLGGVAWLLVTAFFAAGGNNVNITAQQIN
jgi:hypothetical protein